MIAAALSAFREILTPPFRAVLLKSLILTLVLLVSLWWGLEKLVGLYVEQSSSWLASFISILTGLGFMIGLGFLIAPVSAIVAGFFLDELAERVEIDYRGLGHQGKAAPTGQALWLACRFALMALLVNLSAFLLFLIPGVNALVFFLANSYLLGREYFELAASRYGSHTQVRHLRRQNAWTVFQSGMVIAAFMSVPILNLLTPLFGTAFMVRVHLNIKQKEVQPLES